MIGRTALLSHDPYSGERSVHVRKDIARRLRLICIGLSAPEFALLIEKMMREQIRGENVKYPAG
jgi:hypothetical protein